MAMVFNDIWESAMPWFGETEGLVILVFLSVGKVLDSPNWSARTCQLVRRDSRPLRGFACHSSIGLDSGFVG